jgi:hypothetical protein
MKSLKNKPESFCSIDASTNSLAFAYFKNDQLVRWGKIKFMGNDIYEKIIDTSHKTRSFFDQFEDLKHLNNTKNKIIKKSPALTEAYKKGVMATA